MIKNILIHFVLETRQTLNTLVDVKSSTIKIGGEEISNQLQEFLNFFTLTFDPDKANIL